MKHLLTPFTALLEAALHAADQPPRPLAQIALRSETWDFATARAAVSSLTAQQPQAELVAPADATAGFTLTLTVDLAQRAAGQLLVDIPDVLSVRLRQHDPRDRGRQNYPAFRMPDGTVPVLDARLLLHSPEHPDWREMTIGIPLAMLEPPLGEHTLVLHFSGVRWTLYADGVLLDNDFPFGYPRWPARTAWRLDPAVVRGAALHCPALSPMWKPAAQRALAPVQYWTPPAHNDWVGDVATFFHQGRYHVFYLYDRRHHQSKFGRGAHYFEHLSTADFVNWTEHEAAAPLEAQWECIGTGTPFAFDGRLCLAYGLHTERIYPDPQTTLPAQMAHLATHGRTGTFDRGAPGAPIGSTYSISADGIASFAKTWRFFHPCRNPSVYRDPEGRLRMLANSHGRGTWEADRPDGGWRCVDPGFPPGGDCTFFFRWGRFDYIIGGFRNLWSKPAEAPEQAYVDLASQGLDCYDGLNVPAVTEVPGGRFLLAGWTAIRGWGGNLVIRELLQQPDGRLGARWMPELMPATGAARSLAPTPTGTTAFPTDARSFLLTFDVQPTEPGRGKLGVAFLPERDEQGGCELQVRLADQRAQFGPAALGDYAPPQKSLREGGRPEGGGNYAVERLLGVDRPFTVRVIVLGDDKLGGSLVDAEIASQRTLLSYRAELTVSKVLVRATGVECRNIQLAPLDRRR
jgi:hypothetical protein